MKRYAILMLAGVLLLLAACGTQPAGEPTTAETTAEPEAITKTGGEDNGIRWQVLDPESSAVKDFIKAWYENRYAPKQTGDFKLSDGAILLQQGTGNHDANEIWMRGKTGKDTRLLGLDEENSRIPFLIDAVNERYFLFQWAIVDSDGFFPPMLYDTQAMRQIPIQYPDGNGGYELTLGDQVYFSYASTGLGTSGDVGLRLLCADLSVLAQGEAVAAKDILKGVLEYDHFLDDISECDVFAALSPDARWFAVFGDTEPPVLKVFDTEQRGLVFALELPQDIGANRRIAFVDADTLYWFGDKNIVEIKLK